MVIRTRPANAFGQWLLDRFTDRGWDSYRQAAEYTRISHTQLRSYVQGVVPRPPQLERLAAFFAVERAYLEDLLGLTPPAHGTYAFLDRMGAPSDLLRRADETVYAVGAATVRIDDPRLVGYFYGFLSKWARMTEEERDSLAADEVDIPEPPAEGGARDAGGGGAGAGGTR